MSFRDQFVKFNSYVAENWYRPSEEIVMANRHEGGYDPRNNPPIVNTLFSIISGVKPTPTATATVVTSKTETFGIMLIAIVGVIIFAKL